MRPAGVGTGRRGYSDAMANAEKIDTVILDLDGTLVDSVYVHVTSWRSAFADVGVDIASTRLHRVIGMGGDRLVEAVAGAAVERALGDTVRSRHAQHFDERFGQVTALDGAAELLEALQDRGATMVLATSGGREMADRMLALVEGSSLLSNRVSGSDADGSKPAPDLVELALETVGGDRALMLGDTVWDVEAAARAGVPCVGLLSGGISEAELREAGAVAVFASLRELVDHLDGLLAGVGREVGV